MATPEEQVEMTEQSFEELAASGERWPSLRQVALRSMRRQRAERRFRRSRGLNTLLDMAGLDSTPKKPSWSYRHQTSLAVMAMESDGRLEHRFADKEGRLHKRPSGRADYRDRRYRVVPEVVTGSEAAPEDRFESLAQRIEALQGATTETRSDGSKGPTRFSSSFTAYVNHRDRAQIAVDLEIIHCPVSLGAADVEPGSIWIKLEDTSYPTSSGTATGYLTRRHLEEQPYEETDRVLSLMEDAVRAVEIHPELAHAEAEMTVIYERSFAAMAAAPAGPAGPVMAFEHAPSRRPEEPFIM